MSKTPVNGGGSECGGALHSGNTSLVFDRLSQLAKERNEKRIQVHHSALGSHVLNAENVDPKTGQPLFRP